ncbi:MAG: hypothetical protein ABI977_30630 [Acidobacteriota bacterium]
MKKLIMSLMAVSIMGLVSFSGFAQGKNLKEEVTFNEKLWVNNTAVERGDYLVKYDANTGEITILDGKKVVATAKATVRTNDKAFTSDALLITTTPEGNKVTGFRLGGQHEEIMITEMATEMSKANQ